MSLKDAYTPLSFAPLDLAGDRGGSSSKKELVLFHIPDGLDPEHLQNLVIDLDPSSSRPTSFTSKAASSSRTYEVHPSASLAAFQTLVAEGTDANEQSLKFSHRPVTRAYSVRIAPPSYRPSNAPSRSSSDSASSTSAPAASSAATPLVPRAKPQQPWDRLVGEFKPAGSSSNAPLAPLVLVPAIMDLAGPRGDAESRLLSSSSSLSHETKKEKKSKRKSSSSADDASPKKGKKRDRASSDAEQEGQNVEEDATSSIPAEVTPKKNKKDKTPEKSEKKKKKAKRDSE